MAIDITTVYDSDAWNDLIEQSSQATPFHRAESLRAGSADDAPPSGSSSR